MTHDLVAKLKQLPQLADVVTDQQLGGMAESLTIDRATASRFGITPSTIDNTLYDAFGQRQINTLYTQLNQYHVILEADPKFQLNPAELERYLYSVLVDHHWLRLRRYRIPRDRRPAPEPATAPRRQRLLTPSSSARRFVSPRRRPRRCSTSQRRPPLASRRASTRPQPLSPVSLDMHARPARSVASSSAFLRARLTPSSGTSRQVRQLGWRSVGAVSAALPTPVPLSAFTHFADAERGALDQPPGTVSGSDDLIQSGQTATRSGRRSMRSTSMIAKANICRPA